MPHVTKGEAQAIDETVDRVVADWEARRDSDSGIDNSGAFIPPPREPKPQLSGSAAVDCSESPR